MSAETHLPTKTITVPDHEAMGRQMREKRQKKGIGLRVLASKLGVSAAYLSDLELGKRAWNEQRAAEYLEALK